MLTEQQQQTLKYFVEHANNWKEKAEGELQDCVNVIKQRNDYVMEIISEREKTDSFLDIGCGTGELVCAAAQKGINAIGIDFAEEMINIAEKKSRELNLHGTRFVCCSVFDYCLEQESFDVISMNGFIEYISYKELEQLLKMCFKALRKNGSILIGSRNRLFNIFSLNKYTEEEFENENVMALIKEALQIANANDINDLLDKKTLPLQHEEKIHIDTGIKVSTRYQYTPVQLMNILNESGFEPLEVFPIHIHSFPSRFKEGHASIHVSVSNLLQAYARNNMCLIPQSSTFMIHGKKG